MEIEFLGWVHETFHSVEWLNYLMKYITYVGEFGAAVIAVAVILLLCRKTRSAGACMAVGIVLNVLIVNVLLKTVIDRPRPWTEMAELIDFYERFSVRMPTDSSFPSGHSAICFCCAVALTLKYRWKAFPALVIAACVAVSRIYLCVHYPSDVLGGALIGSVCGAVGYLIVSAVEKGKNKRKTSVSA